MTQSQDEHQIFHDPSGKRWKIIKIFTLLIVAGVGFLLFHYVPQMLAPAKVTAYQQPSQLNITAPANISTPQPEVLAQEMAGLNVPVIGKGPLVRIVHVAAADKQTVTVEAYSNRVTKVLTGTELSAVGSHKYAIERYGDGNGKKIALTFDDGPDAKYTPQVLDVLSEQKMPSSFFLVGSNVVKHPDIAKRMVSEGHTVANHTFTHLNFDLESPFRAEQEITQTSRAIAESTRNSTSFFRAPYSGPNDQAFRDTLRGLLHAQRLGYINTSYSFDTKDYVKATDELIPLPVFDGSDIVMLLHDGGGDRSRTIAYLNKLAPAARAQGYTFVNLNDLYPQSPALAAPTKPAVVDTLSNTAFSAALVWPHNIVGVLFVVSIFSIILSMLINVILALLQMRRAKYGKRPSGYKPLVSVLVPAYNEEVVLKQTVRSLLRSSYRNIEIIIVNDGSKDDTWKMAQKIAKSYKRVRSYTQKNGGKSAALNNGIKKAKGEILICIDADTVFPPDAISKMARHFADPTVGAVAGSVKVGNTTNMMTYWQSLEYTVGIHLERTAQAYLGSIIVVPGACGAWRKAAILQAGGFSTATLAEDCDLTLGIHKAGYRVVQDNTAIGYTEAPQTYRALAKQRFRWIFGNLQAFWKHRDLMLHRRYGWLGMFMLPYALFNIMLPFIFIPVLVSLLIENIATGQYATIALYAGLTLTIQFIVALAGITMARERYRLLLAVPLTRLMYSPLKTYLLLATAMTALRGAQVGWNKLQRTGNVRFPRVPRPPLTGRQHKTPSKA